METQKGLRIGFIGDIVGRPGRKVIRHHLKAIKERYGVDFVIANGENASHGFGMNLKNAKELQSYGIDVLTGGNHTWDKKEILPLLEEKQNVLRPDNYPSEVVGTGMGIYEVGSQHIAVINLMGHYGMPMVENVFRHAQKRVAELKEQGVKNIFIDFHAETTSEKRALLMLLKNQVSAICGTHTHVGTDDLMIDEGTAYVSDVGLSGCCDNVIGMDSKVPLERFLTGLPGRFEVPDKCRALLQMIVVELEEGKATKAFKLKAFDDQEPVVSQDAVKL